MEPTLDFTDVFDAARQTLGKEWMIEFVSQLAREGVCTPALCESKIHIRRDIENEYVFWARIFLTLKMLHQKGDMVWRDFYTHEEVTPSFDFESFFKERRMVGEENNHTQRAYPVLTEQGLERFWVHLYRAYMKSDQSYHTFASASQFRRGLRTLLLNDPPLRETWNRVDTFGVLCADDGTGVSTTVDFIVEHMLKKEDRHFLHTHGYIVRIGSTTRKVYPYGKATKANTNFHATPLLLEETGDVMWDYYQRESFREGTQKKLDINSQELFEQRFLSNFDRQSEGGVQV
jgi:hypothetical protein